MAALQVAVAPVKALAARKRARAPAARAAPVGRLTTVVLAALKPEPGARAGLAAMLARAVRALVALRAATAFVALRNTW
jgi:hypothetical protein